MISSKNRCVFIHDLNDLTVQIIFDASLTSINVDSKISITWNNSRHAPSWRFHLDWGMEETSSRGIICIICHQVLCHPVLCHPSEHGTSTMGKHLLAKSHITNLNKLTESDVVLAAVLDRHFGSRSGSEQNPGQIGRLGRQQTRTVNSGMVQLTSRYPSELGGFSAGCTAGPSVNIYTILAFIIWLWYWIKIDYSTSRNHILHVLHVARSTIF
jgi:hypothetical protein